jgi:hypothetical protein
MAMGETTNTESNRFQLAGDKPTQSKTLELLIRCVAWLQRTRRKNARLSVITADSNSVLLDLVHRLDEVRHQIE